MSEYVADGDWSAVRRNFEQLDQLLGVLGQVPFFVGTGSPNTVVTASPPAIYFNRSGGASTTLYFKESGSATNTGWVAK
jgi:hypothetical protein